MRASLVAVRVCSVAASGLCPQGDPVLKRLAFPSQLSSPDVHAAKRLDTPASPA